jgi:hypothetical protein
MGIRIVQECAGRKMIMMMCFVCHVAFDVVVVVVVVGTDSGTGVSEATWSPPTSDPENQEKPRDFPFL